MAVITAAVLVVAGVVGYHVWKGDKNSAAITIAGNIPLTGPIAATTGQYPNGVTMGVDEACPRFGVPREVFRIDFQDNAGNPTNAVSLFQQQKLRNFDAYISGTSECSLAVAPLVDETGKPHFTLAFDPFFVNGGPNRMRILANSRIEGPLFVQYAKSKKARSVYGLHVNSAYANSEWDRIIAPGLKEAGITSQEEAYDFDQRDFKNLALKVEKENPDLIFVIGYSIHLQPLLRDLRTRGLVTDGRVMSALDFIVFLYENSPREELLGVVFACPWFEIPGKVPDAGEWRDRYTQRFGRKPTYQEAYGYDTGGVMVKAYKEKGKVTTETILAALPYDGVTGTVRLDENRDLIGTLTIARVRPDGKVEEVNLPGE